MITYSSVLGTGGAVLQARAVALAVAENPDKQLDSQSFMSRLLDLATDDAYRSKITKFAALLQHPGDRRAVIRVLGHGVEAFNSVPIAIFTFLSHSRDCYSAIIYAVSQGGDTDTIALMTGAISGAYLGIEEISSEWQGKLENRYYKLNLADRLW